MKETAVARTPVTCWWREDAAPVPHRSHLFPARVAVTGADGFVGQALMMRLLGVPTRTVGLVRKASWMSGPRVVRAPLDSLAAQGALGGSDCVIHLAGALCPPPGESVESANIDTARAVAQAVRGTDVRRIVYLSYVGANPRSRNRYLAAKGEAEEVLRGTGCDLVVLRCTHIVGPPENPGPFASALLQRGGRPVLVIGNGSQLIAPVALDDVVGVIVRALTGRAGTYELAGPDLFDLDELVEMLNGPEVRVRHWPGALARVLAPFLPGLSPELVDVLLRDSEGDPARLFASYGVRFTSLRTLWS